MASKSIVRRGSGVRFSLDLPMAGLAALSVAFVAYAMPDAFFADAIAGTGLSAILPAAAPPLGQTARLSVIVAAALGTFVLIWLVLRAIGSRPSEAPVRARSAEVPADPPRLRRADFHPDAPSRRPLFAGLDLGEPAQAETPDLPRFLMPEPDEEVEKAEEAEEWLELTEAEMVEPVIEDIPHVEAYEEEPEAAEAEVYPEDEIACPPDAGAAAVAADERMPTIPELMERLEQGLLRRQMRETRVAAEPVIDAVPFDDPVDARLRSALDDLQKMAARRP
ncbi:hypothetical protein SH591_05400 [Sphingomonas sp. LY54]|uniref:hypothetical protein n=1 Tax=Sphingomonas sp. LY54 TaxID=3095343 RepID=UPI002D77391D|nr:hypothetical protein [Sphingomonas sp. LY54]WRP29614.1 hypothetical protein SH591_05400 [Sphingomonas sp. LY54]